MKTIKYFLSGLVLIISIIGCDKDFLNINPPSALTESLYFRDVIDAEALIASAYTPLTNTNNIAKIAEATTTDNIIYNTQGLNLQSWSFDSNDAIIDDVWQTTYEGIFRTNIVLDKVPGISISDESIKNRILGEARFLRAFYYFRLLTNFGAVPLITEPDPANAYKAAVPKSPVDNIYELIIEDLIIAIELLPNKSQYDAKDLGRATKGAAKALLGKTYLYQGNFLLAEASLLDAWTTSEAQLLINFNDINIVDNNVESIFEIQFHDIANQGSSRVANDYPQGQGGYANILPTQDLVDEFEFYDGETAINGRDPRLFYSIFNQGDPYDEVEPVFQSQWTPTGYARKKGSFPVVRDNNYNLGRNFSLIRLADVILMYAEAANENGKYDDAIEAINVVRRRVGMPELPSIDYPVNNKNEIFNAIVHERRVELAFEYIRLYDLRRWGIAEQELGSIGFTLPKHQYFPIPQQELFTNPSLVQNEGY